MNKKQTKDQANSNENPIPQIPTISRFDKRAQNAILKDSKFSNTSVKGMAPQFRIHQHKGA